MTRMKTNALDIDVLAEGVRHDPGVIETEAQQAKVDRAVALLFEAAELLREVDKEVWGS